MSTWPLSRQIMSFLAPFPGVASLFACIPVVAGMAFMSDCKKLSMADYSNQPALKGQGLTGESGGFVSHLMFMIGECLQPVVLTPVRIGALRSESAFIQSQASPA